MTFQPEKYFNRPPAPVDAYHFPVRKAAVSRQEHDVFVFLIPVPDKHKLGWDMVFAGFYTDRAKDIAAVC